MSRALCSLVVVYLLAPSLLPAGESTAPSVEEARRSHWAFRPVRRPAVPEVAGKEWPANPIDAFVLARLEASGLRPSPETDRLTLIRRLSFTLTGLPPTPEGVARFERDRGPGAVDRLVDRLLASPAYGERWGRHWLDVARYADTRGYVFTAERRFPFSYTYRDYVIRAFDEDLPYDQFVREQLAADLLDRDGDDRSLAAMGFLTLGRRFLNNVHDIIDDRIDVVSRGLMALTVPCARCHDHKYDPIPSADYYSLYGVFASSVEPSEKPLLGVRDVPDAGEYEAKRTKLQAELGRYLEAKREEFERHLRENAADYLLAAARESSRDRPDFFLALTTKTFRDPLFKRWKDWLGSSPGVSHPLLESWRRFASLPDDDAFAARAAEVVAGLRDAAEGSLQSSLARRFEDRQLTSLKDVAAVYRELFAAARATEEGGDPLLASVRDLLYGEGSAAVVSDSVIRQLFNRADRNGYRERQKKIDRLEVEHPGAPPRAMVLNDTPQPVEPRIFDRGKASNPGESVPRQFLAVLSAERREPFRQGSGRLELARAIASPDNPLTARVLVNRVWMHHFGHGLVRTPGDFGLRGEPPSHPQLMDWLAWRVVADGWSVKSLQRLILTSRTYRQGRMQDPRPQETDPEELDPENRLLWRFERIRLEFEALRDSILAVAGRLDRQRGGRSVDIFKTPFATRRTVYGYVERQNLPGLLRTFDFASPDSCTPQRHHTTVPQQALFLLNGPFVMEQATHLAERVRREAEEDGGSPVEPLFALAFGREPSADELERCQAYLKESANPAKALEGLAQIVLMSNEFAFAD